MVYRVNVLILNKDLNSFMGLLFIYIKWYWDIKIFKVNWSLWIRGIYVVVISLIRGCRVWKEGVSLVNS